MGRKLKALFARLTAVLALLFGIPAVIVPMATITVGPFTYWRVVGVLAFIVAGVGILIGSISILSRGDLRPWKGL